MGKREREDTASSEDSKERKGKSSVDYVQDLGQRRAMDQLSKWIYNHEGCEPRWEHENGAPWTQTELDALHTRQKATGKVTYGRPAPSLSTKWYLDHDTGCWLLTSGVGATGYGVCKLQTNAAIDRQGGQRGDHRKRAKKGQGRQTWAKEDTRAFQWHVVAYLAEYGRNVQADASHLCHRANCFNPTHIVDESHQANLSRRGCWGELWCVVHGTRIVDLCVHSPKCIKPYYQDLPSPISCCQDGASEPPSAAWVRSKTASSAPSVSSFSSSVLPLFERSSSPVPPTGSSPERLDVFAHRVTESMQARDRLWRESPVEEEDDVAPVTVLSNEEFLDMFAEQFHFEMEELA